MSRILHLEPASHPQNLQAEPEKFERVTYRSTKFSRRTSARSWVILDCSAQHTGGRSPVVISRYFCTRVSRAPETGTRQTIQNRVPSGSILRLTVSTNCLAVNAIERQSRIDQYAINATNGRISSWHCRYYTHSRTKKSYRKCDWQSGWLWLLSRSQ